MFFVKEFSNGLTLLAQNMPTVASAAMTLAVPAGASYDGDAAAGSAAVLTEWLFRGAGGRNSRELNDALDSLGCQHHENVQSEHLQFGTAQLGRNLAPVLKIYADILRRPNLDDETFAPCRDLTVQDLVGLEDEPAQKCNLLLREKFYPHPLGRCAYGSIETLQGLAAGPLREHAGRQLSPHGMLLAVAGKVDFAQLEQWVGEFFGDWSAPPPPPLAISAAPGGIHQLHKDSAQSHITLAHKTAIAGSDQYYPARMAETILSGGMSGRLFTEVRENRGLVYHVSTRYHSLRTHAGMFTYAGTSPDRAQQTLEVTVGELRRLGEGITPQELARARTQLKSALVMQGESTSARANALASDWYHLRRLRSLEEISAAIDHISEAAVLEHLKQYPAGNFTVLTIGPTNLDTAGIA